MPNIVIRLLSGLLYVAVLVGCILWSSSTFCILFATITALLLNEFNHLLEENELAEVNNTISIVSGVALFIGFYCYHMGAVGGAIFAPFILSQLFILISGLYLKHKKPIEDWAFSLAGQIFIALPMALINELAFFQYSYSALLPLSVFIFLWLNDTGAYCFGCALSRYVPLKLFPSVSPKKSWIGSVGGGLAVLGGATALFFISKEFNIFFWLGLGLVVCVFGTWGDLVESQFKRQLGIKDSGRFLPGHGGALDRFDSALLAIPAALCYLLLVY